MVLRRDTYADLIIVQFQKKYDFRAPNDAKISPTRGPKGLKTVPKTDVKIEAEKSARGGGLSWGSAAFAELVEGEEEKGRETDL